MNQRDILWFSVLLVTLAVWSSLMQHSDDRIYSHPFCDSRIFDERCFFSKSYVESRDEFIKRCLNLRKAFLNADLANRPLADFPDLFIDFCMIRGSENANKFIVHSSGLHGVEGFSGAAIQSSLMHLIANGSISIPIDLNILFVHCINPFGMSRLRRVNEHNVDLNRNGIINWQEIQPIRDYENSRILLVPETGNWFVRATWWMSILIRILFCGTNYLKSLIVPGQYVFPDGLFYGGNKREQSLLILEDVLREYGVFESETVWIDVHTGLGEFGQDTLLANSMFDGLKLKDALPDVPVEYPGSLGSVKKGYESMQGDIGPYFAGMFSTGTLFMITQEFGTYSGFNNFIALYLENVAYHFDRDSQQYYSDLYLKGAFNPTSSSWRISVVNKGVQLLKKIVQSSQIFR